MNVQRSTHSTGLPPAPWSTQNNPRTRRKANSPSRGKERELPSHLLLRRKRLQKKNTILQGLAPREGWGVSLHNHAETIAIKCQTLQAPEPTARSASEPPRHPPHPRPTHFPASCELRPQTSVSWLPAGWLPAFHHQAGTSSRVFVSPAGVPRSTKASVLSQEAREIPHRSSSDPLPLLRDYCLRANNARTKNDPTRHPDGTLLSAEFGACRIRHNTK